jgi:hypothetical protein
MVVTLLPGTTNVVRFPVELRAKASLGLLFEIAPNYEEACHVAEAFGMDEPSFELRDEADQEMAATISECGLPEIGVERDAVLNHLMKPLLEMAIAACRKAQDAAEASDAATEKLVNAQTNGGYWLLPLEENSDFLANESARLLLLAHSAYRTVSGAARAIELARAGVEWTPRDGKEEARLLFSGNRIMAIEGK